MAQRELTTDDGRHVLVTVWVQVRGKHSDDVADEHALAAAVASLRPPRANQVGCIECQALASGISSDVPHRVVHTGLAIGKLVKPNRDSRTCCSCRYRNASGLDSQCVACNDWSKWKAKPKPKVSKWRYLKVGDIVTWPYQTNFLGRWKRGSGMYTGDKLRRHDLGLVRVPVKAGAR